MTELPNEELPVDDADDVDAHLLKEALASAAVAGAMFAGTAQARTPDTSPARGPAISVDAHAARAAVTFEGGNAADRAAVARALAASSFDWSIVPNVTVHLARGATTEATPGNVYVDTDLLRAGKFAWGVIQHEFAHQVDYFLLDDSDRAALLDLLGAKAWCSDDAPGLRHADYGCERFASTLAWAYWQSPDNSMKPTGRADLESGSVTPGAFRAALSRILSARA